MKDEEGPLTYCWFSRLYWNWTPRAWN